MLANLGSRVLTAGMTVLLSNVILNSVANADIKMLTSRRELGEKMRLISTGVVKARRDVSESLAAPEIPPIFDTGDLMGDADAALLFDDPLSGESLLAR